MVLQDQDRWANDSVQYSSVSAEHRRSLREGPASSVPTPRHGCFPCRYCGIAGERNSDAAQTGVRLEERGEARWSLASAAEASPWCFCGTSEGPGTGSLNHRSGSSFPAAGKDETEQWLTLPSARNFLFPLTDTSLAQAIQWRRSQTPVMLCHSLCCGSFQSQKMPSGGAGRLVLGDCPQCSCSSVGCSYLGPGSVCWSKQPFSVACSSSRLLALGHIFRRCFAPAFHSLLARFFLKT